MSERIGKFELLEQLGQGGMGVVYRARDTRLDREVALKLIRPDRTVDERSRHRFLKECRAAAALNHPNIATLFEADESEDGRLYFAAELVEGETLADLLRSGPLPLDVAREFARQLAGALAAAHDAGIVHRDIKPGNLMVAEDGSLKVLDFGLARLDRPEPRISQEDETRSIESTVIGAVLGTPGYMAPEQITGGAAGPASDVFAAGVVIYEMLSGKRPFEGSSVDETLRRVIAADPDPPSGAGRPIPAGLERIVERCLAKEAGDRYADGAALRDALDSAEATRQRRRPWPLVAIALVLLGAVVGTLWWSQRPALAFETSDRLLIADVENNTDEPLFDAALRTALEVDLQQSRHALIPGRQELSRTLMLTRRPPDTPLDRDTALDLARFAGAKAVLAPAISAIGKTFRLEAVLYATETGRAVDRYVVTADGKEQVLAKAVDRLTRQVRRGLGESMAMIESNDMPVPEVTTESWEALEALSRGLDEMAQLRYAEAIALFEQALAEDPDFVAAKAQMALLLIQRLQDPERGKRLLAEAAAVEQGVSRYERVMLDALALQFVDEDPEAALEGFALVADLFPERSEPTTNRAVIFRNLGRYREARVELEESIRLDDKSTNAMTLLYFIVIGPLRDPQTGLEKAEQALTLFPDNPDFRHMRAWALVGLRRFDEAREALRAILADHPDHLRSKINLAHLNGRLGDWSASAAGHEEIVAISDASNHERNREGHRFWHGLALMRAGRVDEGRAIVDALFDERMTAVDGRPQQSETLLYLAELRAAAGREEEARRWIEEARRAATPASSYKPASVHALLGDTEEALTMLAEHLRAELWDPYYNLILPSFASLWADPRFDALVDEPPE